MEQLLTTKLYIPPTRQELVPRPRLIKQLNAGIHRKLSLISAPAGFGKTTLVSEWVQAMGGVTSPVAIAWLSLDDGDNDYARFLTYFIAALNQAEGRETTIGKGSLHMLQSPRPLSNEAILIPLINEIANIPDRILLVLDDYHLIDTQPIHDALSFLLEHMPPQMHLVIATRDDPQLPVSRLRALGQLTELRAADLRFTSSEAAEFLNNVMGLNLSTEDISALETRTEGWIAGLQLAAISMQRYEDSNNFIRSFTGSHHFVLDYLVEEVLEKQSDSIQAFLMQTAVLSRLTGSLCDALTGQDNGQATLEYLEHANLFIVPLDNERHWYRYHQLFADLLRRRLRQTGFGQDSSLHHRASKWNEQHGFIDEAIEHALLAEEFERASVLIEEHFDAMFRRGDQSKLRRWLAELPIELVFSNPQLCILHAWKLFSSGHLEAAEESLQAAEEMLDHSSDQVTKTSPKELKQLSGSDKKKLQGEAATIRAYLAIYRGDVQGTIRYACQALDDLPGQELTWRSAAAIALGDAYDINGDMGAAYQTRIEAVEISKATGDLYLILTANLKLAAILRMQGQLQRVIKICQQQLQLTDNSGLSQMIVVGWLLAMWGEVLAEINDLDGAIQKAKKGVELTEYSRDVAMLGWSNLCLIRVLFSRREFTDAEEIIQKMKIIAQERDIPPWITNLMAAWQARIWLAQDQLESASRWVEERGLDADGEPTYLDEMEYITLARILIAQGRLDEANILLDRLLNAAEEGGRTSRVIEILMLQALALNVRGNTHQAMTPIEQALDLAESGGFIRIFVDEGPSMGWLLYKALSRGTAPDYVRQVIGAFPITEPELAIPSQPEAPTSEFVEPLSEREIEVLQLIAQGLTNPEVATRLYLSPHTVKVHTSNIYSKLGVSNRTQAVVRAKTFGILPSN